MSIFGDADEQQAKEGALPQLAVEKPTGFEENVAAAWNNTWTNDAPGAKDNRTLRAYDDRIATVKALTGEDLQNPLAVEQAQHIATHDPIAMAYNYFSDKWNGSADIDRQQAHEAAINNLKDRMSPDDRDAIPSADDIKARIIAESKKSEADTADIAARATLGGTAGGVVGSAGAQMVQPEMLPTLALGAPARVGLLARMLGEAGIAAGTQALFEPALQQQRGDLGLDSGLGQAAGDIGSAALGGAAIGGALHLGAALLGRVVKGGVPEFEKAAGRPATAPEAALINQVQHDGEMETVTPFKEPTPENLAVKLQNEDVAQRAALTGELAADSDYTLPPPRLADPAADPVAPVAATDPAAVKSIIEANIGNLQVIRNDDLAKIGVDAKLMQFKAGGDDNGVTDRLRGVTDWSTERAGVSLIYERADGSQIIADGHQRLGLAQRLASEGKDVELPAIVLREVDGVTPAEARARAAFKNIAEGTGTAQDAAKVLRDMGTTAEEMRLPPKSALVRDAEGLVNLNDNVFGMVINDVLSEQHGAIVGRLVRDPATQDAIAGLLVKLKPYSAFEAESIVRQALDAGESRGTQTNLFGDEEIAKSLYLERARVLDRGLKMIRRNVDTFETLSERGDDISTEGNVLNQDANARRLEIERNLQQYITAQAHRKGVIGDALGKAAQSAQDTGRYSDAARQFVESINAAAQRGELDGRAISRSGLDAELEFQGRETPQDVAQGGAEQVDDATLNMFDEPNGPATEDQSMKIANEIKQEADDALNSWFEGSKVADEKGKPLPVYRGEEKLNDQVGLWFTSDKATASAYSERLAGGHGEGANVTPAYLSMKNPLEVDAHGGRYDELQFDGNPIDTEGLLSTAEQSGFDGIIVRNVKDGSDKAIDVYRPVDPSQVKSVFDKEFSPGTGFGDRVPTIQEKEAKLLAGAVPTNDADALLVASTKIAPADALPQLDADLLDFHVPIGERLDEDGARRASTQSVRDIFADLEEDQNFAGELSLCGLNGR